MSDMFLIQMWKQNMHNPHCQPTHRLINAIAICQQHQDVIKSEETQSTCQGPLVHSKWTATNVTGLETNPPKAGKFTSGVLEDQWKAVPTTRVSVLSMHHTWTFLTPYYKLYFFANRGCALPNGNKRSSILSFIYQTLQIMMPSPNHY